MARGITAATLGLYGALARSFHRSTPAAGRSAETVNAYDTAVARFGDFLVERGMPTEPADIRREHVESFIGRLLATRSATTAQTRYRALHVFFAWLVDEDEIAAHPMARMKAPRRDEVPPAIPSDDDLRALLRACEGKDFAARRDTAILRLFIDSRMRRSELAGLMRDDVDLDHNVAVVMGKGRRGRPVPFGKKTALARARYLRARDQHRCRDLPRFWLGQGGGLTGVGVYQILGRRARLAGVGRPAVTGGVRAAA